MGKNRIPFPKTVFEFTRWFPDDKACIGYLYQSRWPQSFVCPKCASTKAPPTCSTSTNASSVHPAAIKPP